MRGVMENTLLLYGGCDMHYSEKKINNVEIMHDISEVSLVNVFFFFFGRLNLLLVYSGTLLGI